MLDELDYLHNDSHLLSLLTHYANLGDTDRETWHPRLMVMEQGVPPEMVKLHGQLIAFGWIEQNTGQVPVCYRIMLAGHRAIRQAGDESDGWREAA